VIGLSWDAVRLFLHIVAASIWVGGQLVLAMLVPTLRAAGAEVPRAAARAYNRVAWPAFGLLILTGVWNIVAERSHVHGSYQTTLVVKLVVVLISGAAAWLHTRARTPASRGALGGLSALAALTALLLGILLAG
jgi:putative copper export protein